MMSMKALMILGDDWNKPEKKPIKSRKEWREKNERSKVAKKCVVCGDDFFPWKYGRGICCSVPCRSKHNLGKRTPDQMGTLYRQEKLDTND